MSISLIKPSDEILRKKLKFQGPTNYAYFNTIIFSTLLDCGFFFKNLIKFIPFSKKILKYNDKPVLIKI